MVKSNWIVDDEKKTTHAAFTHTYEYRIYGRHLICLHTNNKCAAVIQWKRVIDSNYFQ